MQRFWRFCLIGTIGFLVDGSLLVLFLATTEFGPFISRLISFSFAVLMTWVLNRNWAFHDTCRNNMLHELVLYLSVQGVGIGINFTVYSLLIIYGAPPFSTPLFALAIASAISLTANFMGLSRAVFVQKERL